MTVFLLCLLIAVLLVCSAFFSASEISFAKANRYRIDKAAEEGSRVAKLEQYIADHYVRSISAVLLGNDLVNIASSSAATMLFAVALHLPDGAAIATVVMTLLLLLFGETLPKIIAAGLPDACARLFAYPVKTVMTIFKPIVWLVEKLVSLLSPLWTPEEEPEVTTEELEVLVDNIEDEGVFTEEEGEIIRGAIEITDTMAMEILTPRVDMMALDIDDGLPELTNELLQYTRVPVYQDTIDNIIGILSTKKLIKALASGEKPDLHDLMMPPLFVHKTRMISSIIREFRGKHTQCAIVVDEYGGTLGLLTMEDIMEEIVGEIYDERDAEEDEIIRLDDSTAIAVGSANIEDLFDLFEYEPPEFESEYNTIAGWVTERLDRFPRTGDSFTDDRYTVTVLEARRMRVEKVRVVLAPEPEEE
ncbi:MAG: hemolysin family protein [Clostridia bacterium]|nr:hemolysin family protein [Clostridia bacterium]